MLLPSLERSGHCDASEGDFWLRDEPKLWPEPRHHCLHSRLEREVFSHCDEYISSIISALQQRDYHGMDGCSSRISCI